MKDLAFNKMNNMNLLIGELKHHISNANLLVEVKLQ